MPDRTPVEVLTDASPAAGAAFVHLRDAVASGALDKVTAELVVVGALAAKGQLSSLAVHVRRVLKEGVGIDQVRHAIVAPLAAASLFGEVIAALRTVDDVASNLGGGAENVSPTKTSSGSWPRSQSVEIEDPLSATLLSPGQPRAVVLLHSLALDRSIWAPIAEVLSASFTVLACDLPGHGRSKAASEPTVESMADSVASLIESVGLPKAVVIGLSLGGSVAQALTIRHPQRVSALGLADTTSYYGEDAGVTWAERAEQARSKGLDSLSSFQLERWFSDSFREHRGDICDAILDTFRNTNLEGYVASCHALGAMDQRAGLASISCPTAIVVGENDYATPPEHARVIQESIKGSHLTVLPGCKHLSAVERPIEVLTALSSVLSS